MSEILCFHNPGEIDPRLITTMGVNVKETDSPIGRFGTGLKYGIANVLRLGGKLTIQSGLKEFAFSVKRDTIRGKDFDFIEMTESGSGSQTLAFTTDLGKHWQPWMAYREFHCNAIDESGFSELLSASPKAAQGCTRVLIEEPRFVEIFKTSKDWLLNPKTKQLVWATPALRCYLGASNVGFYHGIKVVEFSKPTAFTYDIVGQVDLTEDRTLPFYRFTDIITREVLNRERPPLPYSVLRGIVGARSEHLEHDFYWPTWLTPRSDVLAAPVMTPNLRDAMRPYLPVPKLTRSVFDDLKDDAPFVPEYTCPVINEAQEKLNNMIRVLGEAEALGEANAASDLVALCVNVRNQLVDLMDKPDEEAKTTSLERLRRLNEALRDSGIYWRKQCQIRTEAIRSPHEKNTEATPDTTQEELTQ